MREAAHGRSSKILSEIVGELLQVIRGDDRGRLVEIMREVNVLDAHLAGLSRRDPRARIEAITGLSLFDDKRVIDALRARLDDRSPDVRMAAAEALSRLDAIHSVRVLVDKLEIGSGQRSRTLNQIFRRLVPQATAQLVELLDDDVPDVVKAMALDALGKSGDYHLVDVVGRMVGHESEDLRAAALRALAELNHPAAQPAVMRALTDASWVVRAQAAICAGRIGLKEATPSLEMLLDDETWWVRLRAAEALYSLGDEGVQVLERASRGVSRRSRIAQVVLMEKAKAA